MATTINRQRVLGHLLNSPLGEVNGPEGLPVLEQFIFALCRENATDEQARVAYENLKSKFFDWNEVRVSSVRELEEAMADLSEAESRAQRLIAFLQEVFETKFSFDLEDVQKKGLKQGAKQVMRYGSANDYVGAWVTQRSLAGHAIPLDAPTLRCSKRIGLVEPTSEDVEAARATLEHLVPKAKGAQFTDAISNLAEQVCWEEDPNCPACPLNAECLYAQENLGDQLATARTARAKPR
jgi:endonuclease III